MNIIRLIAAALFGKWSGDSELAFPRRMILFYRLKAAICLLLNLECRGEEARRWFWMRHIVVTYLGSGTYTTHDEPTIYWCIALCVGRDVFRNWYAEVETGSN